MYFMNKFPHWNKVISIESHFNTWPCYLPHEKQFGFLMLQYLHFYKGSMGSVTPRHRPSATGSTAG